MSSLRAAASRCITAKAMLNHLTSTDIELINLMISDSHPHVRAVVERLCSELRDEDASLVAQWLRRSRERLAQESE